MLNIWRQFKIWLLFFEDYLLDESRRVGVRGSEAEPIIKISRIKLQGLHVEFLFVMSDELEEFFVIVHAVA